MSNLDDKLTDIMFKAAGGISDMGKEEIVQIHQAFADEGYSKLTPEERTAVMLWRDKSLMTGQEWYDRFVKAYGEQTVGKPHNSTDALEAAKRASGLADD